MHRSSHIPSRYRFVRVAIAVAAHQGSRSRAEAFQGRWLSRQPIQQLYQPPAPSPLVQDLIFVLTKDVWHDVSHVLENWRAIDRWRATMTLPCNNYPRRTLPRQAYWSPHCNLFRTWVWGSTAKSRALKRLAQSVAAFQCEAHRRILGRINMSTAPTLHVRTSLEPQRPRRFPSLLHGIRVKGRSSSWSNRPAIQGMEHPPRTVSLVTARLSKVQLLDQTMLQRIDIVACAESSCRSHVAESHVSLSSDGCGRPATADYCLGGDVHCHKSTSCSYKH